MDGEPLQEGLCNRSGTEAPHVVEEKDLELYSQRRRELPLPEGAAAGGPRCRICGGWKLEGAAVVVAAPMC